MLKSLILFLLGVILMQGVSASSLKLVGYINPFNCASCNSTASALKRVPDLTKAVKFIYSTKAVTEEQAIEYTNEIIGQPVAIEMNNKLFTVLNKKFGQSKVPVICLYDTLINEIVYSSSIDSLLYYEDVFRQVLKLAKPITINKHHSKPIAKLIGWKSLSKVGDNIVVHAFQKAGKLYVYNLKSHLTDSIMIHSGVMELIYAQLKLPATYAAVNKYRQRFDGPDELMYQFSTEHVISGDELMTQLDVFYYDPNYTGDTIRRQWFPFVFNYNFKTKAYKLFHVNTWNSYPADADKQPSYTQDLAIIEHVNDTLLLLGCDKKSANEMDSAKTKLVLQYVKPKGTTTFEYKGVVADSVTLSSYSFSGKSLNRRSSYYIYRYHKDWIFYEAAPIFLDRKYAIQRDVRDYQQNVTWIFDMRFTNNTITLLCKTDSVALLQIVVDRKTNQVLGKQELAKKDEDESDEPGDPAAEIFASRSNYWITDKGIYMLNRQGEIIELIQ